MTATCNITIESYGLLDQTWFHGQYVIYNVRQVALLLVPGLTTESPRWLLARLSSTLLMITLTLIIMLTILMKITLVITIKVILIRGRMDEAGQILDKAALMNNRTGVSKV